MTKTLTAQKLRRIGTELMEAWTEENRKEIKVKGKTLYDLIGLKKTLEDKFEHIQETVSMIALNGGGVYQDDRSIKIPDENIAEVNRKLQEFSNENIDVEYNEILLSGEDSIPMAILEALYDFISLA